MDAAVSSVCQITITEMDVVVIVMPNNEQRMHSNAEENNCICGCRGPKFLNFYAVFGETIGQNSRLAPP